MESQGQTSYYIARNKDQKLVGRYFENRILYV